MDFILTAKLISQNCGRVCAVKLCKREVNFFARIKKLNPFALCIFFVHWQFCALAKNEKGKLHIRAKNLTSLCNLNYSF